jgi:tetratricopeptide (TPR) repeat protein
MKSIRLMLLAACLFVLVWVGSIRADNAADAQKLVQEAAQLARDKKYDEAVAAIRKALQSEPRNDRFLGVASEIELRAGRFADGVEHALAAIKINDKVGLYYALVAANAYGDQDIELALRYCRKVFDMGPKGAGQAVYNDTKAYEDMLLKKTYTITWNLDPSEPRKRKFIADFIPVALPKSDLPYQSVSVKIKGVRSYQIVKGEANDVACVVPDGKKPFQVITTVTVQPVSYKAKLAKAAGGPLPREVRPYLGSAEDFDPASPKLQKIVAELKGKNAVETVKNIMAWLQKNVVYKQQSSDIIKLDFKSVEELIDRGSAECRGYTMLFAALCRAAGVPARPVWGVLFVPKGYDSHNWDEVYIAGCGWVPVDPQKPVTFGWLPIDHVRVFMDLRKSSTSEENLPMLNLLFMNGEKLEYEQSRSPSSR